MIEHGVPLRSRSFWLASSAILYVCAAVLQQGDLGLSGVFACLALPACLAEIWRRTDARLRKDELPSPVALSSARLSGFGFCLWLAARMAKEGSAAFDLAANLGSAFCVVGALLCLAKMPVLRGLMVAHQRARSIDSAIFASLIWGLALAAPIARLLSGPHEYRLDPFLIDYATTAASVASLLILVSAAHRARVLRKLELGASDRAVGAWTVSLAATLCCVPAALLDLSAPDRLVAVFAGLASLGTVWSCTVVDPAVVSGRLRVLVAFLLVGTPIALLAGWLARNSPHSAGFWALTGSLVAVAAGAWVRSVASPLGPDQSRWLEACHKAQSAALEPHPDDALKGVLDHLQFATGNAEYRAEFWRIDPPQMLYVDVAGYLHTEVGHLPPSLLALAHSEPERTIRTEVVREMQVRRPDCRELYAWLDARQISCATALLDFDGFQGALILPAVRRKSPLALEEARALRRLADRISSLFTVSAALVRAQAREQQSRTVQNQLEAAISKLSERLELESNRNRNYTEYRARPIRHSAYSPVARQCQRELQEMAANSRAICVESPPGVDPIPWLAETHLRSKRSGGPFVNVDASTDDARLLLDHPDGLGLYRLARGGVLFILHFDSLSQSIQESLLQLSAEETHEALPHEQFVQDKFDPNKSTTRTSDEENCPDDTQELASTNNDLSDITDITQIAEKSAIEIPHSPISVEPVSKSSSIQLAQAGHAITSFQLWIGLSTNINAALEQGRISRSVFNYVGKNACTLPTLEQRPEDLRSLIFEAAARSGAREPSGEPIGVSPGAMRALLEYSWPGNESELLAVVQRCAWQTKGKLISLEDVLNALPTVFSKQLRQKGTDWV